MLLNFFARQEAIVIDYDPKRDLVTLAPPKSIHEHHLAGLKQLAGIMDDEETRLVTEIGDLTERLRQVRISKRAYLAGVEIMEAGDVSGG